MGHMKWISNLTSDDINEITRLLNYAFKHKQKRISFNNGDYDTEYLEAVVKVWSENAIIEKNEL